MTKYVLSKHQRDGWKSAESVTTMRVRELLAQHGWWNLHKNLLGGRRVINSGKNVMETKSVMFLLIAEKSNRTG